MEQKVFECHVKVEQGGSLETSIEEKINEVLPDGWIIKQISSCVSTKKWDSRESPDCYIHLFLLAEKSV